jgi:hypothetical protein
MAVDFDVSFTQTAQVGSVKLGPGRYRLALRGAVAVFTEPSSARSFTVIVKVEKTPRKSTFSAVLGNVQDGVQKVDSIILAGADFKLGFAN